MTRRFATTVAKAAFCFVIIAAAPQSFAQTRLAQGGAPSSPAKPGQFENKDAPVQIEAATLEVHDKSKTATFSGNVQVVQGDTTMRCRSLVVFYGQEVGIGEAGGEANTGTAAKSQLGGTKGAQNIRRIEARGSVTVLTKDQSASGDLGIYDLKTKTITLSGNVVVSQGQNVIHGERVVVDTETGNARVESGSSGAGASAGSGGRVRALIQPGKGQGGPSNFMTIGPGRPN
ncbi:MAG TPA: LptA/OstA family protein [Xanthobacteraceae bacterium]|jgi:lipopolysaccharide export system protein LptA|nr:LptA/OstA family protein [Xanthobacteraceae bacterium]